MQLIIAIVLKTLLSFVGKDIFCFQFLTSCWLGTTVLFVRNANLSLVHSQKFVINLKNYFLLLNIRLRSFQYTEKPPIWFNNHKIINHILCGIKLCVIVLYFHISNYSTRIFGYYRWNVRSCYSTQHRYERILFSLGFNIIIKSSPIWKF